MGLWYPFRDRKMPILFKESHKKFGNYIQWLKYDLKFGESYREICQLNINEELWCEEGCLLESQNLVLYFFITVNFIYTVKCFCKFTKNMY